MASNAFEKFISAFDTSAKREEQAGRNFFADAMDANKTNNTLMNDAVTRAFNQQTIDQRGQQFPYALAGLSRADEIARLMQPANAALTGVTSNYLVDQAGNGAYGAQVANRFSLQGVLGATNLTNAQTAAQNAEFTNAYVNKDAAALGALMGIPAADITFDPATGVATQVSTGKALHPQGFNVAMSQLATKSAAEQAAYLERMNAVKAMMTPGASTLPTAPTTGMASRYNPVTPAVMSAPVAPVNTTPMTATWPETSWLGNQAIYRDAGSAPAADVTPTASLTTSTPDTMTLVNQIAAWKQLGLNTNELETQLAAQQRVADIAKRNTPDARQAEFDATRGLLQGSIAAAKLGNSASGHVPMTAHELMMLQQWVTANPSIAVARGVTSVKIQQAILFNQAKSAGKI